MCQSSIIQVGLPDWLTDVRNEIAHGKRLLSLDFLSSVVDRILQWLRSHFWTGMVNKYSGCMLCFIHLYQSHFIFCLSSVLLTGGIGSPLWLQLEDLLINYEQQTFRATTVVSQMSMQVVATRRRVALVKQLTTLALHNLKDFCECFVRPGFMFLTPEQLSFLGVDNAVLQHLTSSQNSSSTDAARMGLVKRVNAAFMKTRKFWKMLIVYCSAAVDHMIPALIESIIKSCPNDMSRYEKYMREKCWLHYLVDKYVASKWI